MLVLIVQFVINQINEDYYYYYYCRSAAVAQFVRPTQLSLRGLSGYPPSSRHGMQEGTGQNRKIATSLFWWAFEVLLGFRLSKSPLD